MSDSDQIKALIEAVTTLGPDGKLGGRDQMRDDCIFIRPTGNPLTMPQWDEMMKSPDVVQKSSKLVKVSKLVVDGNMAYAVYVSHAVFSYKGTDNDDVAVFTAVFQKGSDGKWMMVHGQRSTGRKPDEPQPDL